MVLLIVVLDKLVQLSVRLLLALEDLVHLVKVLQDLNQILLLPLQLTLYDIDILQVLLLNLIDVLDVLVGVHEVIQLFIDIIELIQNLHLLVYLLVDRLDVISDIIIAEIILGVPLPLLNTFRHYQILSQLALRPQVLDLLNRHLLLQFMDKLESLIVSGYHFLAKHSIVSVFQNGNDHSEKDYHQKGCVQHKY